MHKNNESVEKLLNQAYNCKSSDLKSLLFKIESELEKDQKNQTILRAKTVITSRIALNSK
ncbi:hypothetical protein HYG87_10495 [Methanobacterium alkalithermotolerans]|uniref:Uncharacterized protein n=1 Tax=Methanobacterium alkalithermotolerans TaxID=2731220 RepID=A0A8T8K6F0_9EURY|nr:hypothetical protein [Methanobacterium alkalithermotolerans]QUH24154.1 hypothetical protein HYG87_10495 [Methanobacterium alkalithermotolerans]RJS49540.1 MAG: hypothetical protein CIT03_01740 [Methanobacterium sp.]